MDASHGYLMRAVDEAPRHGVAAGRLVDAVQGSKSTRQHQPIFHFACPFSSGSGGFG
jgi:hypothetical protein